MYRNAHITARKARYQGMSNQPPDPDPYGTEEKREKDWQKRIAAIVADLIKDEEEASIKYQRLIDELHRRTWNSQSIDLAKYIQSQEVHHKALLQRLRL